MMRRLGRLFITAGKDWLDDKAPRLAAALSYYTVFRCEWGSSSICGAGLTSLLWDPRDRLDAISELIDVSPSEKAPRMK